MKQRKVHLVLFIGLLALVIAGCGGGGGGGTPPVPTPIPSDNTLSTLGNGAAVDVARFNGKYIYTMITAQPSSKPEGYGTPTSIYPYTFTTTAGVTPSYKRNVTLTESSFRLPKRQIYRDPQTKRDLRMRQAEDRSLAGRARQIMNPSTNINPAAPAGIIVGTPWDNVLVWNSSDMLVTINTTCRYVSDHAYFFVDNRDTAVMAAYLADYGTAFDLIYHVNKTKLGNENDVDGNGKVIIVFSEELTDGLLGYFSSDDKYPKTTYSDSNEGDIFYLTVDAPYQGDTVKGTLAHEFQHMIYFDEHYNRGVISTQAWLNEALSQAAEYYNGYLGNHLAWIENYLDDGWSGLSLTHWTSSNYGYGAVYIRYLIDQYGDTAIKNMCATNRVGINAVEAATGEDFNTIFTNFTRALVLSGTGDSTVPRYQFTTLNLQTVQSDGRGGLTTSNSYIAGDSISSSGLYPYRIFFAQWSGTFGTMNLSGSSMSGTAFGISR